MNRIKEYIARLQRIRLPGFMTSRYFIAALAVLIWLLFFDKNNFIHQRRMSRQLKELRSDREYYLEQIASDSAMIEKLENDPDALERYGREQYLMKKENEDIYIIKP